MPSQEQVREWQDEHRRLINSWEYAFAMSSDRQIRNHPQHRDTLQRVRDLRALIAEHREV